MVRGNKFTCNKYYCKITTENIIAVLY